MPDESHLPPESTPGAPATTPPGAPPAQIGPDAAPASGTAPGATGSGPDTTGRAPDPAGSAPAPVGEPDHAPAPAPVPDEAELARVAEPATVRRAPKFGAFLTAGVLLGAVLGFVVAVVTGSAVEGDGGTGFISFLDGQGSARLLVALAGALLGALVAGTAAILADRRSVRRR